MQTIKIYGASDDLIEVYGKCKGCDEYNAGVGTGVYMGTVKLNTKDNCVNIHCIYDGSWAFAVCPQDGDFDTMPWIVTREFGDETAYSETISITVPDECVVSYV